MTGYLEDTLKAPRALSLHFETFEMPERILEEITCAAASCQSQKAARPDLIIGDALRASAKLHIYFIAELW